MIRDRILTSIVAAALAKGLVVGWLIPPFQTPDEYGHYDYAIYLSTVGLGRVLSGRVAIPERVAFDRYATRELLFLADATGQRRHLEDAIISRPPPAVSEAMQRAAVWAPPPDEAERLAGLREVNAVFNYPPLYYGVVAILHRAGTTLGVNPLALFYAARALSLVLFLATIVAAHRLALALGLSRRVSLAVAFALAFQPQLTMQSVSVQSDNLSLLLVTLGLLGLSAFARESSRASAAGWGVATGLLLLTKVHLAVPLVTAAAAVALWHVVSRPARARAVAQAAMVGFGSAALVGGGWLVRSRMLYGNWTGQMVWTQAGSGNAVENLRDWWHVWLPLTFRSWWGEWGWLDYGLPDGLQPWLLGISLAPAVMLVFWWVARGGTQIPGARVPGAGVPDAKVPGATVPGARVLGADEPGASLGAPALQGRRPFSGGPADGRAMRRPWVVVALAMGVFTVEMLLIAAIMGEVNNQGRHWLPFAVAQMLYLCVPIAMADASRRASLAGLSPARRRAMRITSLASGVVAVGGIGLMAAEVPVTGFLDITMRVDTNSTAEVFVDAGRGFNALEAERVRVLRRDGEVRRRFPVRAAEVHGIRVDPLAGAGTADIGDVRLLDADGRLVRTFPAASLHARRDIDSRTPLGNGLVRFKTIPGAVDPVLEIPLPEPVSLEPGLLARAAGLLRRAWHGALRRLPLLAWLSWLTPLLVLVTLASAVAGRIGALLAASPEDCRPVDRLVGLMLASGGAFLLALNAWLMLATREFYYG